MGVPARSPAPAPEAGGWFRRKPVYDRRTILAAAATAQGKGKSKKALAEYQKVLAMEPDNPTLLMKAAVLFAETRQPKEAWGSFTRAAELFRKDGLNDKWSSVWVQAVIYFPRSPEAWLSLAQAKAERGVPADAAAALLTGSRNFKRRKDRDVRVQLLQEAFRHTEYAFDVTMEYAAALVGAGEKKEAMRMLEELAERTSGAKHRKVRGRLFRMSPTPAAAWRWARATFRRTARVTLVK
jgi:tetratricopeptide (TPR) repeat protein